MSGFENCKIYQKAIKEGGCCVWYMDNVVCGNKSEKDCPQYKNKKIKSR